MIKLSASDRISNLCSTGALLFVLSLVSVGCGQQEVVKVPRADLVDLLPAGDPLPFDRTTLFEREPIETLRFADAGSLDAWTPTGFDQTFEIEKQYLKLKKSTGKAGIARAVDWDAAAIDAVELEIGGLDDGKVRLYWAAEDEKFDRTRSLQTSLHPQQHPPIALLDVSSHPRWRGKIARIRLDFTAPSRAELQLLRLAAVSYRPLVDRVSAAVEAVWRIELDHEVRRGMLALPGVPLVRTVEVPAAGMLSFGHGVDTGVRGAVDFAVTVERADGSSETLFSHRLSTEMADEWYDNTIELERFHGETVTLRFATRSEDLDLENGAAFWSNPEIVVPAAEDSRPNIILISIDTLRADHLSLYGYERETSPFLDRWSSRRGVVFENAVAAAPWTAPSHLSIFSGLDALHHGINHPAPAPEEIGMMAEFLSAGGYKTVAVTGGVYLHPRIGLGQGFDRYRYWPSRTPGNDLESGIAWSLDRLDEFADRPLFLFLHTYQVHYPYARRQPFFDRLSARRQPGPEFHISYTANWKNGQLSKHFFKRDKEDKSERMPLVEGDLEEVFDRYDSGVAYTDSLLALLLEKIEDLEIEDETIVIVTSDHGEALGEKELAGHAYLYDFNLMVPLIFSVPGAKAGRIEHQVRSIDILPTVLELAGLPAAPAIDGVSLVSLMDGTATSHPDEAWSYSPFSNRGLALRIGNRSKYLYNTTAWSGLHGAEELYDLRSDPGEERNLVSERGVDAELRQRIREAVGSENRVLGAEFRNATDKELRGRFWGTSIDKVTVKGLELPTGAVNWRSDEKVAEFLVRPGESYRLSLERVGNAPIWVAVDGSGPGFEIALDPAESDGRVWSLYPSGESWDGGWRSTGTPDPPTGIIVGWRGPAGHSTAGSLDADPVLVEQLRALGYVE